MNANELLEALKNETELEASSYDGSYEVMRATIEAYSSVDDWNIIDYTDLDLIYLMAVGTFSDGLENKRKRVRNSHLAYAAKLKLLDALEIVWDNVCLGKYSNDHIPDKYKEEGSICFGMFGTGFYTFSRYASDEWNTQIREFIKMLVDIRDMTDDDEIYDRAQKTINYPIKGLQAASVSIILHCLKPYTFPILNGNEGKGNCFEYLGIQLTHSKVAETYIGNCRKIKAFRDANFAFKNYRIIDLYAEKMDSAKVDNLWPSLTEYPTILTKEQWIEFLEKDRISHPNALIMLKCMYDMGGEASCKELAQKLGGKPSAYISRGTNLGKRAKGAYGLPPCMDGSTERFFPIAFQGHLIKPESENNELYSWVLRKELSEAISEMDIEEVGVVKDKESFNLNTILYGPPGTGKTYNTVLYAVAIIENDKSLEEISAEAERDYEAVKKRYESYKESGLISFTTFHQSYGYEDFIEGIRPVLDNQEYESYKSNISYEISPGIFKEFCDRASRPIVKEQEEDFGLNHNPAVWKVSLEGAGDNETRRECLENNHIRIGWDEYGPILDEKTDYVYGGEVILDAFYNKMQIGDIVVSCYNKAETDAIGVITGDSEWVEEYNYYRRVRKVKWLVKDIRENILRINNGTNMTLSSIYKMKVALSDVMDIVRKYTSPETIEEAKNYVFIIDEINRGNISKIFGELITLIEPTKRLGRQEEARARLPYSGIEFGVPSNVYILGTMNTADRSIALMDTALRRRFSFVEMMPNTDVIEGIIVTADGETLDVARMLSVINDRIEYLYDREHTIGHAFFTDLRDNDSLEMLADIFKNKVVPLLQEYFYEDYEKIQLVLGDDDKSSDEYKFIYAKPVRENVLFKTVPQLDLHENKYVIQEEAFDKIQSYIEITEKR